MIYFVFKKLRIGNMGGILPRGVNVLGDLGEWNYACVENAGKLQDIAEHFPIVIDEGIVEGLQLRNVNKLPADPTVDEDDPNYKERELTEEEKANKVRALTFLNKLDIRSDICAKVGDLTDIVTDVTKLLGLVVSDIKETGTVSDSIYAILENYMSLYPKQVTGEKLKDRLDKIANIMKNYK